MFTSIEQIKKLNEAKGFHFFEKATKNFFRSRILPTVYKGFYFITSEQFVSSRGIPSTKMYSIRKIMPDGRIQTINGFQHYKSLRAAKQGIKNIP